MCELISRQNGGYVADIKARHIDNIAREAEDCKNISRIVLFGSATQTRCTDQSDIDIAVFGRQAKGRYLASSEFKRFQDRLYLFDLDQDYDILYFRDGQEYHDPIMEDIRRGTEIFRRELA